MSRKLLYLFGGTIILLVLVVVALFIFQRRTPAPRTNTNAAVALPNVNTVILNTNQPAANANTSTTRADVDQRKEVEQLASDFASIYGSFSNQNNYKNITDLYFFMAPALRTQQESFVAGEQAKQLDVSMYKGANSVAQIVTVEQFNLTAGTAQVKVTLQRVDTTSATAAGTPYYQDFSLTYERLQGAWKVTRFAWGQKL